MVRGIGPKLFQSLVDRFGSPEQALNARLAMLQEVPGVGSQLAQGIVDANHQKAESELIELCEKNSIKIVCREELDYPKLLLQTPTPPNFLFTQGAFQPEDSLAIAIVGSRHATRYGEKQAESLARGLALSGFTVVSGMARGIDAAAHRGALKSGGRTLAVLGSGLLDIYPTEHAKLAKQIAEQGALVSEYHPLQSPKSGAFPQRNRIVSGLCLGTIVVEAAKRSGALISARLAMEQGREVYAVPGPIHSRMSRGCHQLLRDGATLVESVDDVLEQLGPLAIPAQLTSERSIRHPAELKLSSQETMVLQEIGVTATPLDEIVVQTGLPTQRVLSTISVLEMRKLIRRLTGTTVARV